MVELTIVSGFLGAGKTTLLRQLIVHSLMRGERCVVIENEFGSVGLDAALLAQTGVPVHELNQGCVCCTLKSSFVETLRSILAGKLPDRVFFEPSGIFIPDGFLETIRTLEFSRRCRVASFITVVDAKMFGACRRKFGTFFHRQAEFADVLAISKAESTSGSALDELQAELREINPRAVQRVVARDDVPARDLASLLDGRNGLDETPERARSTPPEETPAAPIGRRRFRPLPPTGHEFDTLSVALPAAMSVDELAGVLAELMSGRYGDVVRAKGQLATHAGCVDFSLAAGAIEISRPTPASAAEESGRASCTGRIVVIGEALDRVGIALRLGDRAS
ncbi:MAG: GTP-binding protein [Propionivibrio sp.]